MECLTGKTHFGIWQIAGLSRLSSGPSFCFFGDTSMKTCTSCNQVKVLLEFYKDKRNNDGRTSECKVCRGIRSTTYAQTERGRCVHRKSNSKYARSFKGKLNQKCKRETLKYKATQKRYRLRHPDRDKAKNAVYRAIKRNLLPRADTCQCTYCPSQAAQHHHYNGYKKQHWLDVEPVCKKCHTVQHKLTA